jgi:flagellar protein FlgJ
MTNLGTTASASMIQTAKGQASIDSIKRSASAVADAASGKDLTKAAQAAKDFEAVFITEMLKPMFSMIEVDETFGGGKGEEVFRDFMVQEYGKMITKQGGIGIAAHVKAELLRLQEHGSNTQ